MSFFNALPPLYIFEFVAGSHVLVCCCCTKREVRCLNLYDRSLFLNKKNKKKDKGERRQVVAAATAAAAGHSLGQNVSALAEEGPNTEPEGVGYGIAIGQLILRLRLYPLIRADSRKHKQQARKGS